jgi:hypothetical protein
MALTEIEQVLQEITEARTWMGERVEAGVAPLNEEIVRVGKALVDAQTTIKELTQARLASMDEDGRIRVREGRFAGWDALDLTIFRSLMLRRLQPDDGIPINLDAHPLIAEVNLARKSLADSLTTDTLLLWEARGIKRRAGLSYGGPGIARFRDDIASWRGHMASMMYRRALDSTTAGSGDELVPTLEAAELWLDVNLDTLILPLFTQSPMPSNPFDIPGQLGDSNWYPSTENIQATTTDPATSKTTLNAFGLKTGVPFSDELEEDSIIALVPEIRRSIVRNAAEVIDDVLLNADTAVTNNMNADGATISKTSAGKAQWLLGFDGIAKLPISDNTSQTINKTAQVDADIYNRTLALLGKYAVPRRRGDVVYITDVTTMIRSLSITEFETVDVAGARATLSTGELLSAYGKPIIQSEQLVAADVDGKVTDAGNGTNTGRILCVNTNQWRVGFRRQITIETEREAGKGQTTMYLSFRMAFTERTGTRSTATHTSAARNILSYTT